ncbi:MAG: NAD-glutamate dehydrogenase, partial [Chloroflexi bacterium]|nr:NAD-glutamate dehydrogenase [Chloroflexota bacterium]
DTFAKQSFHSFLADFPQEALLAFFRQRYAMLEKRGKSPSLINVAPLKAGPKGTDGQYTLIEVLTDNRPFITDSVLCLLAAEGLQIRAMFHPLMHVERGTGGKLKRIRGGGGSGGGGSPNTGDNQWLR